MAVAVLLVSGPWYPWCPYVMATPVLVTNPTMGDSNNSFTHGMHAWTHNSLSYHCTSQWIVGFSRRNLWVGSELYDELDCGEILSWSSDVLHGAARQSRLYLLFGQHYAARFMWSFYPRCGHGGHSDHICYKWEWHREPDTGHLYEWSPCLRCPAPAACWAGIGFSWTFLKIIFLTLSSLSSVQCNAGWCLVQCGGFDWDLSNKSIHMN